MEYISNIFAKLEHEFYGLDTDVYYPVDDVLLGRKTLKINPCHPCSIHATKSQIRNQNK
jgi:hypothetical protein